MQSFVEMHCSGGVCPASAGGCSAAVGRRSEAQRQQQRAGASRGAHSALDHSTPKRPGLRYDRNVSLTVIESERCEADRRFGSPTCTTTADGTRVLQAGGAFCKR